MRSLRVAVLAAALAGCSSENAIDLRVVVSSTVSDADVARIAHFNFDVSGDHNGTNTFPPSSTFGATREERLRVLTPVATGKVRITVTATGPFGAPIASGATMDLALGGEVSATVTLGPAMPPGPDLASVDLAGADLTSGSTDLAGVDLAAADLAATNDLRTPGDLRTPTDLAVPVDLASAPDLSSPDLVVAPPPDLSTPSDFFTPADFTPTPDLTPITVDVVPHKIVLGENLPYQFNAVTNDPSGVTWSVSPTTGCGFVSSTGAYQAPFAETTCQVIATGKTDVTASKSATVIVSAGPLIWVDLQPRTFVAAPGEQVAFTATTNGSGFTFSITEGSAGGTMAGSTYTAPAAPGGPYHVVATSNDDDNRSATATINVQNTVVVSNMTPPHVTLLPGESHTFSVTVSGTTNKSANWTATRGMLNVPTGSTIIYTAPATAGPDNVTASASGSSTMAAIDVVPVPAPADAATLSGTVTDPTGSGGRIFIAATRSTCCTGWFGTSIVSTGPGTYPYKIRGVTTGGMMNVTAWHDLPDAKNSQRYARLNWAIDPLGTTTAAPGAVNANITLAAPAPATFVSAPMTGSFGAADKGLYLGWRPVTDASGHDLADHYNCYASISAGPSAANHVAVRRVSAAAESSCVIGPLDTNSSFFLGVEAVNGAGSSPVGALGSPVRAIYQTGGTASAQGKVFLPANATPPGPLIVTLAPMGGPPPASQSFVPLVSPTNYILPNLAGGNASLAAHIDLYADGEYGPLDPGFDPNSPGSLSVVVAATGTTILPDLTLPSSNAIARVTTDRWPTSWSLGFEVTSNLKNPTHVTLANGASVMPFVPVDLGIDLSPYRSWSGKVAWTTTVFLGAMAPGATEQELLEVEYYDGTAETLTPSVTGLVDFAINLSVGPGTTPQLNWKAPGMTPAAPFTYEAYVYSMSGTGIAWLQSGIAGGQASYSIPYMGPTLTTGTAYTFEVRVVDANGNRSHQQQSFTP